MTRSNNQLGQGSKAGIWEIISESPVRKNGVLVWDCVCPAEHHRDIPHHDLQFGVTPTTCSQCVEAERQQRAAVKADERRIAKEIASMMVEQRRQEKEQLAEIVEDAGNIRVLKIEQQEGQKGHVA